MFGSWKKPSRKPARRNALRGGFIEKLEERRLLTITSGFDSGTGLLTVSADVDNISISASSGQVKINGLTPPSGSVAASAVTHIHVSGGAGTQSIDLSNVTSDDGFSSMIDTQIDFGSLSDPSATPTSLARYVTGSDFDDTITGTNDVDNINGGEGNDVIHGLGANDTINGAEGGDQLYGDDGNDVINGGGGNNLYYGGTGDDLYTFSGNETDAGSNTISDTSGSDTLDFSGLTMGAGLVLDLSSSADQTVVSNSLISLHISGVQTIANVIGTSSNDVITGNSLNNNLQGGQGNDTYKFAGTTDQGTDTITDTQGINTVDLSGLDFGVGATVDLSTNASEQVIHAADGRQLTLSNLAANIRNVVGTQYGDTLTANVLGSTLDGQAGTDNLIGGDGNDTLFGGADADNLTGGGGDDYLAGGTGGDFYNFNGGNMGTDKIVENPGEGADVLWFSSIPSAAGGVNVDLSSTSSSFPVINSAGTSLNLDLSAAPAIENVYGTNANDTFTGNGLNNGFHGNGGDDTYRAAGTFDQGTISIYDTSGTNTLDLSGLDLGQGVNLDLTNTSSQQIVSVTSGGVTKQLSINHADAVQNVIGTKYADHITGSTGANVIQGGLGNDTLIGGTGNDTYVFGYGEGPPSEADTVTDSPGAAGLIATTANNLIVPGVSVAFKLSSPTVNGVYFSFASQQNLLATTTGAASPTNAGNVTFSTAGPQTVWGRVFDSSGNFTTFEATIYVNHRYAISGLTSTTTGTYSLSLTDPDNTNPLVSTTWTINWGDNTPLQTVTANPTVSTPVVVTHSYPSTVNPQITATVVDVVGSHTVTAINAVILGSQPYAPTSVSADTPSTDDTTLRWSEASSPAATGYVIYRSSTGLDGSFTAWQTVSSPSQTTYAVNSLDGKWYFKVQAVNASGGSPLNLDPTFTYNFRQVDITVEVSAQVQSSPAIITLQWPQDIQATSYTIYRRLSGASSWGSSIGTAAANSTGFVDGGVTVGVAYDYMVTRTQTASGPNAIGYITSGINLPLQDTPGTVILIVDNTMTSSLATELATLEQDLMGEGWKVVRHDVARATDTAADSTGVQNIKSLIEADYSADPTHVKQVMLIGHVPIPYSGDVEPDGHPSHSGAYPADVYYGDMDGTWTDVNNYTGTSSWQTNTAGDGKFDTSYLSGSQTPELAVGRIDLANFTLASDPSRTLTMNETQLLQQYLDRDHAFRTGAMSVASQALIVPNFGNYPYPAGSNVTPFANYGSLVGAANITSGIPSWFVPASNPSGYLFGYGEGFGTFTTIRSPEDLSLGRYDNIGITGDFLLGQQVGSSIDVSNVVFNDLYGSYIGEWSTGGGLVDSFLRAPLAGAGMGLTSVYGPGWSFYGMGIGGTIGQSVMASQNGAMGSTITGAYEALMGDPTLHMLVVAPASNISAAYSGSNVTVNWTASPQTLVSGGYNIYRSVGDGTFVKVNSSLVTGTTYTDTPPTSGVYTYMVRAVTLETSASGTFFNASEGVFATTSLDNITSGTWHGVYGAQGQAVAGDTPNVPTFATMTIGGSLTSWASPSSDPRAPQVGVGSGRIADAYSSLTSLTVDLAVTGAKRQVSFYLLDWDHSNRVENVQVFDVTSGALLYTQDVSDFENGAYLTLELTGHVQVKFTSLTDASAVMSGIFFNS